MTGEISRAYSATARLFSALIGTTLAPGRDVGDTVFGHRGEAMTPAAPALDILPAETGRTIPDREDPWGLEVPRSVLLSKEHSGSPQAGRAAAPCLLFHPPSPARLSL